jgi:hypothetical protein
LDQAVGVGSRIKERGWIIKELQLETGVCDLALTIKRLDVENQLLQRRGGIYQDAPRGRCRERSAASVIFGIGL